MHDTRERGPSKLLADRGFTGIALWQQAVATAAELLWRAKNNMTPRQIEVLADESRLGQMRLANTRVNTEHVVERVVDYTSMTVAVERDRTVA